MPPPPPETPPPIIPDYDLLRPIGKGSYGEVWLARSVTGVFRVIKIVRRDRFEDERPYLRELEGISRYQAAASGHPRQLALLHVGRNDPAGYFYYVMEPADDAVDGSSIHPDRYVPLTLKELSRRRGRLPASECVELVLELARGVVILHAASLIHRDIKPSNIIFVQRVPKLADVGLVASSEATLTCAGTPGYAPPEGAGTVAADLFSLGKVLYEIATGFDRMDFPRLPEDFADAPDAPLRSEINAILLRACHPDPRERHPSAAALVRDLELVQAGRSVAFYEALRRRLRAAAFAAALLALFAGGGAGLFLWRSQVLQSANEQARRALYRSDLAVAQLARSSGDLGRARAALQRQIPTPGQTDLRGLEWAILNHAVRGEGRPLEPAAEGVAVQQLATDPTGRWAAASFADDTAAIWDLPSGRILRRLPNVRVLGGFTPEGLLVVDETNRALRFESPTNGTVARRETGQRLGNMLRGGGMAGVRPDGQFSIIIVGPGWQTKDRNFTPEDYYPEFMTSDWATDPDGVLTVAALFKETGSFRQRMLVVHNNALSRPVWSHSVAGRVNWVRVSSSGDLFAVNIGGITPTVYSFQEPSPVTTLHGHTARVEDAAFSPNGAKLATTGSDQSIRCWNAQTGEQLHLDYSLDATGTAITWLANSEMVLVGDERGGVQLVPAVRNSRSTVRRGFFNDVHGDLTYCTDGNTIACSITANSLEIASLSDLSPVRKVTNVFQPVKLTETNLFALGSDFSLRQVDLYSDRVIQQRQIVPSNFKLRAWGTDIKGTAFTMTGDDGAIYTTKLNDLTTITNREPDGQVVWALSFSPDSSSYWTGNVKGGIRKWPILGNKPIETSTIHAGVDITALAISPNNRWLAVGSFADNTVRIYDRVDSRWIGLKLKHRRFVQALVFTQNSTRLVSGGADGQVVFWSVPDFERIATFEAEAPMGLEGDEGIAALRVSPSGDSVAALTEDGRLAVWRTK